MFHHIYNDQLVTSELKWRIKVYSYFAGGVMSIRQSRQDEYNWTFRTDLELKGTKIASKSLIGQPMNNKRTDLKRLNLIFA